MEKIKLIGISGKAQSGKDTAAVMIQQIALGYTKPYIYRPRTHAFTNLHQSGWYVERFANNVKKVASLLLGCPIEKFEDGKFKESYLGKEWNRDGKRMTVREFLQRIGTDALREGLHKDVWVNSLLAKLDAEPNLKWIIPDVRFPNELDAIKSRGGVVIRINRIKSLGHRPVNLAEHESETALDSAQFDYTMTVSNLSDLYDSVKIFCQDINIIK